MRAQRRNRRHDDAFHHCNHQKIDDLDRKEIDWHQLDFYGEEENLKDRGIAVTFQEEFTGGIAVSVAFGIT